MIKSGLIILICFVFLTEFIACNKSTVNENAVSIDTVKGAEENFVSLTEEQVSTIELKTEEVTDRTINGFINATGQVTINKENEALVSPVFSGKVMKIFVKEGQNVKKGQSLAILKNTDLPNIEANYIKAKSDYEYSKKEYLRQKSAFEQNLGTQRELSDYETKYAAALANLKASESLLKSYNVSTEKLDRYAQDTSFLNSIGSSDIVITSPIDGTIINQSIFLGEYVDPSKEAFHIINTNILSMDINIYDKDLSKVATGQRVSITTSTYPDDIFDGQINFINKVFNENTRTVMARVVIKNNSGKLIPLMFINARIYTDKANNVLSIPVSSVTTEDSSSYIFIEQSKNVFKKTDVELGITDDKYVEIISGASPREKIVTDGVFYLRSALIKPEE